MKLHEKYVHYRDRNNVIQMTVCLVFDDLGNLARGIAIKSKNDNPSRMHAREYARSRAFAAYHSMGKNGVLPIHSKQKDYVSMTTGETWPVLYSEYNPSLTEYQQHVVDTALKNSVVSE